MNNGIKRAQDLGTLTLGAVSILDPAYCQEVAGHIADRYKFERDTPMELRCFANGLRQLANEVDEQAVLVAEALAEIECAKPTPEETKETPLKDDEQFGAAMQHFAKRLKQETPTAEELLNHSRALLRGDSVDIEGL